MDARAILTAARLPLRFDRAKLLADLSGIAPEEWVPHFNQSYFEGEWSGVALRAPEKTSSQLFADPTAHGYVETPVLARCPYLREVIATFSCPLRAVRLLKLSAGSSIREHRDHELGFDAGEVRLHVPVVTNPDVAFYLNGERVLMEEGECWYLNLNLPHRVQNDSATDRIHLVIDCVLDGWLRALIVEQGETREAGPESGFEQFRRLVLADGTLQARLREIGERGGFVAAVVELGSEHRCLFSAGDVDAALQAARRAWHERHL